MVNAESKAQSIFSDISGLLDCTSLQNHSVLADDLQVRLSEMMNADEDLMVSYLKYSGDTVISETMKRTILMIGKPRVLLSEVYML